MNEFEIQVGKRIRALRETAGYSREQLSELANIGPKFLYEIEVGKKGMSAYTLLNLSGALHVSCDYLLTGETKSGDSGYIQNILSTLDAADLRHTEKIILHIAEIAKGRANKKTACEP